MNTPAHWREAFWMLEKEAERTLGGRQPHER